jgi:hypothetical protein
VNRIRSIVISTPSDLGVDSHMSERTVEAGRAIAVWSLGAASPSGYQVLRNGVQASGGQGILISWKSGLIKVKNNSNAWWLYSDGKWSPTTAP